MKSTHPIRATALQIFNDKNNPLSVRFAALKVVCTPGAALNVSVAERCIQSFLAESFVTKKEQRLKEQTLALLVRVMKAFEAIQKKRKLQKRGELVVKTYEQ